jgi:hypothetical protein
LVVFCRVRYRSTLRDLSESFLLRARLAVTGKYLAKLARKLSEIHPPATSSPRSNASLSEHSKPEDPRNQGCYPPPAAATAWCQGQRRHFAINEGLRILLPVCQIGAVRTRLG